MAKLSDQLKSKSQVDTPITRTQKVRVRQAVEKNILEKQKFEALSEEAKKIQAEKFVDKKVTVDEQYNIYRPSRYSVSEWNRKSQKEKDYLMKSYFRGAGIGYHLKKRHVVVHSTGTRKVDKIIPFTLEDVEGDQDNSYKDVYDGLSPDLQKFFDTPDVVLEKKAIRIKTTKQTVQDKIAEANQKIAERKEYYAKKEADYQEMWSKKSSKYRSDPKNRERRKERLNDWEDDLEEDIAKQRGYIKGLAKGSGELNKNKDIDFNQIERYALDVASYEEDKEEARNDARNDFYSQRDANKLNEDFKKLGYTEDQYSKVGYYQFNKKVDAFNKEVAYKNQLVNWADKVGFDKISPEAQAILNPDAVKWQKENPQEKLIFDKIGNVKGIESGKLQQSISIGNYDTAMANYKPIQVKKPFEMPKPFDVTPFLNNKSPVVKPNIPSPAPYGSWSYNSKTGLYQSPSEPSGQATAIVRQPTQIEQKQLDITKSEGDYWEDAILTKSIAPVKKAFKYVDDRVHLDIVGGGMTPTATLSFGVRDKQTIVEDIIDEAIKGVDIAKLNVRDTVVGEGVIKEFEEQSTKKNTEEYQSEFDKEYLDRLISGEIDFDTASLLFEKSDKAKELKSKFQEDYEKGIRERTTFTKNVFDENFWTKNVLGGGKQLGLNLLKTGLETVKSPTKTVVTAGALYGGTKLITKIPKVISLTATGGFGVYGTYKALNPLSTYEESGAGFVTAVLSFGTLSYAGYKYLKSPYKLPVIRDKPNMANVKSAQVKGYNIKPSDLKKLGVPEKEITKVLYEQQKLLRVGVKGVRQPWTSQGRFLSNKYLGTKLKPLTTGSPIDKVGKATTYTSTRGSYTIREPSAYQNMYKRLIKYGYSPSQATAGLRYTAPRIYEVDIIKQELLIQGDKALGFGKVTVSRPVIDINKNLGIKTRGGGTTEHLTVVKRQLIQSEAGKNFVLENQITKTYGVNLKGIKTFKQMNEQWNLGAGKSSETMKGYDVLSGTKDKLTLLEKVSLRDVSVRSGTFLETTGSVNKNLVKIKGEIMSGNPTTSRAILIDKIEKIKPLKISFGTERNIPSKPFTFNDNMDDIIKEVGKVKTQTNMNVILDKLDDLGFEKIKPFSPTKTSGTILKEKISGTTQKDLLGLQEQLKTPIGTPNLKITMAKSGKQISDIAILNGLQVGSLTSMGLISSVASKSKTKTLTSSKLKNNVRNMLKEELSFKVAKVSSLKQNTQSKLRSKSMLDLGTINPLLNLPKYRPPKTPTVKNPINAKPFFISFLKSKIAKKKRKGKKDGVGELAYLPDFTSRALGLSAESVTEKQAQAQLKKIMTGLEVRRGVKVKW